MKHFILIILLISLSACSTDYSGSYLYVINQQKTYLQTRDGQLVDAENPANIIASLLDTLIGKTDKPQKIIRYEPVEFLLTLKQQDDQISGKLTITDKKRISIYHIKSGFLTKTGLQLKLVAEKNNNPASISLFSSPAAARDPFITLEQTNSHKDSELSFKLSGATDNFGKLFPARESPYNIYFRKISGGKDKTYQQFIRKFLDSELKLLDLAIEHKNFAQAQQHQQLIDSLGGKLSSSQWQRLDAISSNPE